MKKGNHFGFDASERQPATGSAMERDGTLVATQVATMAGLYDTLYINNPAHRRAVQAVVQVHSRGLAAPTGRRASALLLTGPSAAGKTSAIQQAMSVVASTLGPIVPGPSTTGQPVVYVAIDVGATNRRLWTALLEAMGSTFVERSTEENLRRRAYVLMQSRGVSLVVFDEVQHLARSRAANDVTDVFKRILDDGIVPLVLAGTDDARRMFQGKPQICNRMVAPCEISPLSAKVDDDVQLFQQFLARLDAAMLQHGLTTSTSDLGSQRISECIMQVSGGLLGRAVNLIREALVVMVRREGTKIEVYDLWRATEQWAVPLRLTSHNAFVAAGTA